MSEVTTDGLKIIDDIVGADVELQELCEQATVNAHVAQLIYTARVEAGLSQQALAEMIDTTQAVISHLEEGDYEGNALSMLGRVARAMGQEVKIELAPIGSR